MRKGAEADMGIRVPGGMPPREIFRLRRQWNRLTNEQQDTVAAIWKRHVRACRLSGGDIEPDPAVIRETITDMLAGVEVGEV